ncbi:MAG: CoA transferase [Pseudomonadota bacterium]
MNVADDSAPKGPLSGYRVLDLTTMVSGPISTMMLADQGADVIKVEPLRGETMRNAGIKHRGMSSSFLSCNRNKRSLAIDLKRPEGLDAVRRLLPSCDVVVQNFRPGAIERMGLGLEVARAARPDIIFVSISGFGEEGPYAGQRVYDPVIQALCGLADIQRDRDSGEPRMVRTIIPDKTTSVTAAQAITAALLHRERFGEGQHIKLAMLDTMVAYLWPESSSGLNYVGNEVDPARAQMGLDLIFKTLDGYITAATVADAEWRGFCRAVDRPDMLEDPRFASATQRSAHQTERRKFMSDAVSGYASADVIARLRTEDVPCAPVYTREQLMRDEQVLKNGIIEQHEHPVIGPVRQPRPAVRFEKTPANIRSLAPYLGEHNADILRDAGLSEADIAALAEAGVTAAETPGG